MAALTVDLLYRLWQRVREDPTGRHAGVVGSLLLAALCAATGLLAHYEGVFALVPAAFLLWRIGRRVTARRAFWGGIAGALALGVAVVASFYVPFLLNPALSATVDRLGGDVVGTGASLYNHLEMFAGQGSFYTFAYLFALEIVVAVAALLAILLRGRRWFYGLLAAFALTVVLVTILAPQWLIWGGVDVTPFLVGAVLLLPVLAPPATFEERMVWSWLGVPFLAANFIIQDPNTHFYILDIPWLLIVGIALASGGTWVRRRWGRTPAALAAGVGAAITPRGHGVRLRHLSVHTAANSCGSGTNGHCCLPGFPRHPWGALSLACLTVADGRRWPASSPTAPSPAPMPATCAHMSRTGTRAVLRTAKRSQTGYSWTCWNGTTRRARWLERMGGEYRRWGTVEVRNEPDRPLPAAVRRNSPPRTGSTAMPTTHGSTARSPRPFCRCCRRRRLPGPPQLTPEAYRFGDEIELTGFQIYSESGGGARGQPDHPDVAGTAGARGSYRVALRLVDGTGAVVGEHDAWLACLVDDSTDWEPGDRAPAFYRVPLTAGEGVSSATLLIEVYDAADGRRLAVTDGADVPLGTTLGSNCADRDPALK